MIESMILNIVGAFVQHIGKALVISIPIYLIVLAIKYCFKNKRNISKYRCILEYFIGRYMDVDDIIWNTVGALIGSYMCAFVNKLLSINNKKKVTQIQPML